MGKSSGKSRNILKLFNILKIWMVSDKTIHMACRIHKNSVNEKKKTLEKFLIFIINQNYNVGFKLTCMVHQTMSVHVCCRKL